MITCKKVSHYFPQILIRPSQNRVLYLPFYFSLPSTNSDGLIITSINENDGGEYLCSAINDAGSANKTITVTVQGKKKSRNICDRQSKTRNI